MKTGMLWLANGKEPLIEKVAKAAKHYRDKYGRAATLCFVNPKTVRIEEQVGLWANLVIAGLEIHPDISVAPGHFFIGVRDEDGETKRPT